MKSKVALIAVVMLVVLVVTMALCAGVGVRDKKVQPVTQETQSDTKEILAEESQFSTPVPEETQQAALYEDGMFTFTAEEFYLRFGDTLPEGYVLADAVTVNTAQDNRMQINILDTTGTAVDIGILFDVKEPDVPGYQMALVIKEGGYQEDAVALLEWYITQFFVEFDEEKQASICETYQKMYNSRSGDYKVFTEGSQVSMMSREIEDSGNYYYVIISIQ